MLAFMGFEHGECPQEGSSARRKRERWCRHLPIAVVTFSIGTIQNRSSDSVADQVDADSVLLP